MIGKKKEEKKILLNPLWLVAVASIGGSKQNHFIPEGGDHLFLKNPLRVWNERVMCALF